MADVYLNTPGSVTRFLGYQSIPYQDWVNQQLNGYIASQPGTSESSLPPEWMANLMQFLPPSSDAYAPTVSDYQNAIKQAGGYEAIGFNPDQIRTTTRENLMRAGLDSSAYTIDANGNIKIPLLNQEDPGHFGPFTFGGSEGRDMAGLALIASSVAGGAMGGGGGESSSPAGFGDAGYSGSAGGGSYMDLGNWGVDSGSSSSASYGGTGGGADNAGAFDQSGSQGVFDSSGNPLYGNQEPGMWDWLDNVDSSDSSMDFGNFGVDEGSSSAGTASNAAEDTGAFDQFGSTTGPGSDSTIFGGTSSNPFGDMSIADIISKYGQKGYELVKSLLSRSGGGSASSGGGILGSILNDPLGAAFDATPFLLALNEANKQSSDLNGVLNSVNADSYRKAVLDPYDMDTGTNRYALQNDLGLRGVAGSSFGNQTLNSYDYTRAMGRGDLASKAAVATAALQGNLINQRNTNRNMLLGAGLNASAKLFSPPQDPFNLRALLGA